MSDKLTSDDYATLPYFDKGARPTPERPKIVEIMKTMDLDSTNDRVTVQTPDGTRKTYSSDDPYLKQFQRRKRPMSDKNRSQDVSHLNKYQNNIPFDLNVMFSKSPSQKRKSRDFVSDAFSIPDVDLLFGNGKKSKQYFF